MKNINNLFNINRSKAIGFLLSGGDYDQRKDMITNLLERFDTNHLMVARLDFNCISNEEEIINKINESKKLLLKSDRKKLLVIESFNLVTKRRLDVIKKLISCKNSGIDLLISSSESIVHLVGLSEYLIRLYPSDRTYSNLYRLSTQKVLYECKGGE